ncbi:MAG: FlgT C-terminal domain-containing protein [Candidatus Bathyarchaeia archaeon]|jgi:hypothetical protein
MSVYPLKGCILKILSPYKVVINLGKKQGVLHGMKFIIYEEGKMINDPKTGKPIEQLEIVKATIEVTHVQENIATAESLTVEKKIYPPMRMGPFQQTVQVKERLPVNMQEPKEVPIIVGDLVKQAL